MTDLVDFAGVLTCTWLCAVYVTTPEAAEAPMLPNRQTLASEQLV